MSLKEIHIACREIIIKELFEDGYGGPSLCCRMYDAMIEDDNCENCIGENFNQRVIRLIDNWFDRFTPEADIDYYFESYNLQLYLFFERIEFVFNVVNHGRKNKLFNDFYFHNFKIMTKIAKWANFIKHPKEFLFTHWPIYYFEGTSTITLNEGDVLVNTDFIFNHYMSDKKPSPTILENNSKVYVELPDLIELTQGFCDELNIFIDFISKNQLVYKYLEKKSTIEDYYK
jgi:hypothetical protein